MKNNRKKNLIFFIVTVLIASITYRNFIAIHYSTDMYSIINEGLKEYAIKNSFTDGRVFMGIIDIVGYVLNIKPEVYKSILTIFAILISSISVIKLKNIILKMKSTNNIYVEIVVYIISYCTIFNFIIAEYMYFIESFIISVAILLIIYASDIFISKNKYCYLKSIILCAISVLCYQATIPFFIALTFTLSTIKNKQKYKNILNDLIKSGLIIFIGIIVNIILVKNMTLILNTTQSRIEFNIELILYNIKYICNNFIWIFNNQCNLYINGLFICIIIGIIFSILNANIENKKTHIINLFLIIFITVIVNFAMHIPTLSAYYAGRTKFAIGTIIGLLFMYIYLATTIFDSKNWVSKYTITLLLIYTISIVFVANILLSYSNKVNKLENESVMEIETYMKNYEDNNNVEVKNIAIINIYNQKEKSYYREIQNNSVIVQDAVKCDWSADGVINFYSKRKLRKIQIQSKNIEEYMLKFENEKDYICVGDTLIIKTYMY